MVARVNPVTFTPYRPSTSTAGSCSLSGSALSYTGVGNCIIDANQAGNANYNAAPLAQKTFAVGKGAQAITFTSTHPFSATGSVGSGTPTLSATGGGSGNPVTFTIDATSTGRSVLTGRLNHLTYTGGGQLHDRRQPGG